VTLLLGLQTFHPFAYCPSWGLTLHGCTPAEKAARMRDPDLRARLLSEVDEAVAPMRQFLDPERAFPMSAYPNYEPGRDMSLAARARAEQRTPMEVFYDVLIEDEGMSLVLRPLLNYTDFSLDAVRTMLEHPTSAWGLGDGGAHCGTTCDASTPTFMLAHWTRDRDRDRLPIEWVVRKMTAETSSLYGFSDRGTLTPGKIGDVNLVDYDNLRLPRPEMVADLPADARRFVQGSEGYVATVKRGEVVLRDGVDEGRRPGRLVRGV
jgi:N-acyl-D-aspartate/D-glutamate deacylase